MIVTTKGSLSIPTIALIKQLEASSNLPITDSRLKPTPKFLGDLAKLLSGVWRVAVDATEAWQVWLATYAIEESVATKSQHLADIAYWYSINPYGLADTQLYSLHSNLPRVKAQRRLESGDFEPTDYEQVYSLTLVAYDDEPMALAARAQSMKLLIAKETAHGGNK